MEILIGKVTGSRVDYSLNSQNKNKVTLLQIATSESVATTGTAPGAAHDMQLLSSSGEDTTPQPGARVAFMRSGGFNLVVATDDMITPTTNPGEKELYSIGSTGTTKYARLKLKNNGKIFIDSASNSMDLYTALSQLTTALSNLATALGSAASWANIVAAGNALAPAISTAQTSIGKVLDASA